MISYFSVCSGVEAASVAWHPLGWRAIGFAEINRFASAVLAARWPEVPNYGDFTFLNAVALPRVDVLVGGTPCQAFSFAGPRTSLADARGNLTLAYAVLAHEFARSNGLRNAVWENVPGVLSTDDNAFGCFMGVLVGADAPIDLPKGIKRWPDSGMVAGPRARLAWRILDAQYFGLAQRRERVFVVVDFGNGADPVSVLFEPKGVRGNPRPRREAGQEGVAATLMASLGGCSGNDGIAGRLAFYGGGNRSGEIEVAATLTAKGQRNDFEVETFVAGDAWVRRFTPAETARLQGFPDDHACIAWRGKRAEQCPDGPQYKVFGNSMAVNVMRWIGERLDAGLRK